MARPNAVLRFCSTLVRIDIVSSLVLTAALLIYLVGH
jgi:hypothetical protein